MASNREAFTVRVLKSGSDVPVGVGFVVDETHIVTCAHVVNAALVDRDQLEQAKPGPTARVQVEFPMLGGNSGAPSRSCVVEAWDPPPVSGVSSGDVAGLVVAGDQLPRRAARRGWPIRQTSGVRTRVCLGSQGQRTGLGRTGPGLRYDCVAWLVEG